MSRKASGAIGIEARPGSNMSKLPFLIALGMSLLAAPATRAIDVGDMAPDFSLQGTDGKTHRLADYRGKRAVVLAWFPKAFTGGCTAECKSLR